MADQKKIIKVNELTIQAENVHFEPIVREGRPVHPLFGPRPPRVTQPQPQAEVREQAEETEDAEIQGDDQEQQEQQDQPERRPPFSWI